MVPEVSLFMAIGKADNKFIPLIGDTKPKQLLDFLPKGAGKVSGATVDAGDIYVSAEANPAQGYQDLVKPRAEYAGIRGPMWRKSDIG